MLVDPLVLRKKLNRMATEQGAFAVLSSLLLYVTELAAGDPQLSSKRTKWAEGKENKVSSNQPCPDPNRAQHPTRFQLLRSRFLNNNREPYTKKRREVGKLVIKEKLWVNRAGNKLERSRDRKGDGKAAEEDAGTVLSERARWSCTTGKNTVKDILKKFLAAEEKEKETQEKSPSWKKKGPNNLPKIVHKSSVLSKLKEKFEQSALCSAAEVKAPVLRKGEKKAKNFPSRKTIRKPEVRVLRTAAVTATGISSPESQYLVCSTVPVPKLSIATKINPPWSWSKNPASKQPLGPEPPLKEKWGSGREPGDNKTPTKEAQDREDKELPVTPPSWSDVKDHADATMDSTKEGPSFDPNLDISSTTHQNQALADCTPPLSECGLDCDRSCIPPGLDTPSLLGMNNAVQPVQEDSPASNLPYSSTAGGSHEQSPQKHTPGEIPEITMYVYSSEEVDTELTEPELDLFSVDQKCFPEQKALENILPNHSPGVLASCEAEPPKEDGQLTLVTSASGIRPSTVQKEAPGSRGSCSEEAKKGVKYHSEGKLEDISRKNGGGVPTKKELENETPNSQMQNESKPKQLQPPQTPSPQNHFHNSHVDISNPDANQTKPTLSSRESQEQKPAAEEEHISSHLEKTENPLPGDLVKHSAYTAEDFGKDKLFSSRETMNHANNQALHRSTLTDLETCYNPSKSFIECEEGTADEMPWLDSEVWLSPSSTPLPTPMSGTAEQRTHHTLGNPPTLPPIDQVRQEAGGVRDEHASHDSEKHPPPSSDKLTNHGNDTVVEKKTVHDFKNQALSPNHATENENTGSEETNTHQRFENCLSLSTKKPGKPENKTTLARKPLLPLEKNQTPPSDDTTKQGSDILEDNLLPSSAELVSDQKKHVKGRNKVSKHTKDSLLSSDNNMKNESDRMETKEREERNILPKSEEEQVFPPRDTVDHDNFSNEISAHRPKTSSLPSSEHDTNIQGVENTEQSSKHLTPSKDFVKQDHDMAVDENICCNKGKHHLSSSNEPMKHANDSAGETNIKSNFKNHSTPPRNASRQDNKNIDEDTIPPNLKNEPVQHKKSCEEERNTLCDPEKRISLSNPLMKQEKKLSPLETQKQKSPDDVVKPESKLAEKKTKRNSEKLHSPSPKNVLKPQERSSSEERKQKTPTVEDTRLPETKSVKEENEHQPCGKYQLHPSRKSAKSEENSQGGDKQQMRCEDFVTPDTNAAKEKKKLPSSKKYRSVSSETLVKPQEKNPPEQKQLAQVSTGFKKPGTNAVKEKDEDPNSEQSPSSKKVVKSREKNTSGDRKQKTPAAEDIRTPEVKAVKGDDKHQHSGNHQLPPSNKPSKPEKNPPRGENQQPVSKSFTKPEASDPKEKSKDPGPRMCQSPSSNSLVKPQEKNTTDKKKHLPSKPAEKTTSKTGSPEKKSGPERGEKYQLHSSAQSEKQRNGGSGKESPRGDFKSCQAPSPSDGIKYKSNTLPKESSLSDTEESSKSSSFPVASKNEENPAGKRKNQPGFRKYQALSSKMIRKEKDVAEREGSRQAAGKTSEEKAELEDCSKAAAFSKYTVESYSESPLDSSFKPLIIRVTDTFKHHS